MPLTITPNVPNDTGIVPTNLLSTITTNTAGAACYATVNGRLLLVITTTGACVLTIKGQATIDGQTIKDLVITLGTGDTVVGPIPAGPYAQSDGTCDFRVSTLAFTKFWAISVP